MTIKVDLSNMNTNNFFTSDELFSILDKQNSGKSISSYKMALDKLLKEKAVVRVGRNCYVLKDKKISDYFYLESTKVMKIENIMSKKFPLVEYQVFELNQLNNFLNHQIAHNVIFLSVEKDLDKYIFEELKEKFKGDVLLNPTTEEYNLYWNENLIVINRLRSESPKNRIEPFKAPIEKFLVDIYADKIIKQTYSLSEYPNVLKEAFDKYIIDESKMFRYARRRNCEQKILDIISKNNIKLRTR